MITSLLFWVFFVQQKKIKKEKKVADKDQLKKYMDMNGIKYKHFAEQLGLTHVYFYRMMQGERNIPKRLWPIIARLTKGLIIYGEEDAE
jgi:hypothetical protein